MTSTMLARRGTALACRINGFAPRLASQSKSNQKFSSLAHSSSYCSAIHSRSSLPPSTRPHLQSLSRAVAYRFARAGSLHQSRHQSSLHDSSPIASTTFDGSVASSELVGESLDPVTRAAAAAADGQWYLGYLKDAGLDFGYGPSSMMMWLFEHIHVWGGCSFGISVLLLATSIRCLTFAFVVGSAEQSARLRAVTPQVTVVQRKIQRAKAEEDQIAIQQSTIELKKLYKSANIRPWKLLMPLIQMPLGFGVWRLLRNAAELPAPGMTAGGFLWFPNLTFPDPYFILPVFLGLFQHLVIRVGGENGTMILGGEGMRKLMFYVLPAVSVVVVSWAPAAVQLSFVTSIVFSLLSNVLMRSNKFRASLGISPIVKNIPTAEEVAQQQRDEKRLHYKGTINVINNNANERFTPPQQAATKSPSSGLNPLNWMKNLAGQGKKSTDGPLGEAFNTWAPQKAEAEKRRQIQLRRDQLEQTRRSERQEKKREMQEKQAERRKP